MGTEDQILKCTELFTNTKKQRLKIQSRGYTLKNIILTKQNHKSYIKNMNFALKIGSFFKVIVGFKNEN